MVVCLENQLIERTGNSMNLFFNPIIFIFVQIPSTKTQMARNQEHIGNIGFFILFLVIRFFGTIKVGNVFIFIMLLLMLIFFFSFFLQHNENIYRGTKIKREK